MIEWPDELPNHALREGFTPKPRSNVIAHQTQTGPGTTRRRQSSAVYEVPVPIYLKSESQRHAFQRFWEETTQSGSKFFIWPELDRFVGYRYYKYKFDDQNPYQLAPMGAEFTSQINLTAWPDAQPINIVEDGILKLGTLTQSSITYYDANGDQQTAPADTPVIDYNPIDGAIRGLPLGADGQITVPIALAQDVGTLKYTEQPAIAADRLVYALSDGTANNRIALLVEGGNYIFRVTVGGTDVADIDTGVECIPYKHQEIDASYAIDAFYAAASGGSTVSDTDGALPNITQWVIGDPGNHTIQCWILDYSYVPRALREFNPIESYGPGYLELAGDGVKHPLVQVTRNTEATYFDANGVMQTAGIDEPVFEYRPESGELWLRKEQQATNTVLWSNDLTNPAWSTVRASITAANDYFVLTADLDTDSSELAYVFQEVSVGSNFYCQSVDVKSPTGGSFLIASSADMGYPYAHFDLSSGSLIERSIHTDGFTIYPLADGWFRVSVTSNPSGYPGDRNDYFAVGIPNAQDGEQLFIRRPQKENGRSPTSYIPTTDSASTRAADDIRVTDLTPFNGFSEGTFVAAFETAAGVAVSSNETWILTRGVDGRFLYRGDILRSFDGRYAANSSTPDGAEVRVAGVTWGDSGMANSANGGAATTAPFDGTWGNGNLIIGEKNWSGWIKSLRWIPRRVSDAELQALTSGDA